MGRVERAAGIEPASSAWKAEALPLSYARRTCGYLPLEHDRFAKNDGTKKLVEAESLQHFHSQPLLHEAGALQRRYCASIVGAKRRFCQARG